MPSIVIAIIMTTPTKRGQEPPCSARIGIVESVDNKPWAEVRYAEAIRQQLSIDGAHARVGARGERRIGAVDGGTDGAAPSRQVNSQRRMARAHRRLGGRGEGRVNQAQAGLAAKRRRNLPRWVRPGERDRQHSAFGADRRPEQQDLEDGHQQQQCEAARRAQQAQRLDPRDREEGSDGLHASPPRSARRTNASSSDPPPARAMSVAGGIGPSARPSA